MVAVRSSGLAFDSIVGYLSHDKIVPMVSGAHLTTLITLANARFKTNEERKSRFEEAFSELSHRVEGSLSSSNARANSDLVCGKSALTEKQR